MAYKLGFEFQDAKSKTSSSTVWVPSGFTQAQYESFAQDWIDNAAQIALGIITGAKICIRVPIGSIDQTGKPAAASDVEEVGEYIFESAAGFKTQMNLPAYDEADTLPNSDAIDQADAGPAALISAMLNGVTLTDTVTVVEPCDIGGSDIDTLLSATERFRNSGKFRR